MTWCFCDVTWRDVTWRDVTWRDVMLPWHDITRRDVKLHDIIWHYVMWCDIMWHAVTLCGVRWYYVTLCDIMWQDMTLTDLMWCNVTQHDVGLGLMLVWKHFEFQNNYLNSKTYQTTGWYLDVFKAGGHPRKYPWWWWWNHLVFQERSPLAATLKGDLKVVPHAKRLATFMSYFDTN